MNPVPHGAHTESSPYRPQSVLDVVVFPTFIDLQHCIDAKLMTGAQFAYPGNYGAQTGDICMVMLQQIGCHYVLCGHSERRRGRHAETNEEVAAQAVAALELGIHPIVCVGETEAERNEGNAMSVVKEQLDVLPLESDMTIAYEPVWAIGTGTSATPDQVAKMHAGIRSLLPKDRQEHTRILYGGSVKPENAKELLELQDVDGALVGSASLKPAQFQNIINAAITLSV